MRYIVYDVSAAYRTIQDSRIHVLVCRRNYTNTRVWYFDDLPIEVRIIIYEKILNIDFGGECFEMALNIRYFVLDSGNAVVYR